MQWARCQRASGDRSWSSPRCTTSPSPDSAPGACRGLRRQGRRPRHGRGSRHAAANDRFGRRHSRTPADSGPTRPDATPCFTRPSPRRHERASAIAIGLIDVGCSAGLSLNVDRVGITYDNGQSLGNPLSSVQVSSSVVGDRPIATRAMPEVVARVGVDVDPRT